MKPRFNLRPPGFDDLGLRRALSDKLLPFLVGAMVFLAALAFGAALAANGIATHWRSGAAALLTVQVPRPDEPAAQGGGTRAERAFITLRSDPSLSHVRKMTDAEMQALLRPWLGDITGENGLGSGLPTIMEARVSDPEADPSLLLSHLSAAAPGIIVESGERWTTRLNVLARSLQLCAWAVLLLVMSVATAVVVVSVRTGLAIRREAIHIVHGLGATDQYIALHFASRIGRLSTIGAAGGILATVPVLISLSYLTTTFVDTEATQFFSLTPGVWSSLLLLPVCTVILTWSVAYYVVIRWLRRLL